MAKRMRLKPNSNRAQMDFGMLEEKFSGAVDTVKKVGEVNLPRIGIDWNSSILTPSGSGIGYSVGNIYSGARERVAGEIRNCGHNEIGINVSTPSLIGIAGFTGDEIVRSLSEAIKYAEKLDVIDGTVFLPAGEGDERGFGIEEVFEKNNANEDVSQYRAFAENLLNKAKKIVVGRQGDSFGNYVVAEMPSGFFVAYSNTYGDAPYVVTDINVLKQDKQTIRKNSDAVRFRRDRRGSWDKRILAAVA